MKSPRTRPRSDCDSHFQGPPPTHTLHKSSLLPELILSSFFLPSSIKLIFNHPLHTQSIHTGYGCLTKVFHLASFSPSIVSTPLHSESSGSLSPSTASCSFGSCSLATLFPFDLPSQVNTDQSQPWLPSSAPATRQTPNQQYNHTHQDFVLFEANSPIHPSYHPTRRCTLASSSPALAPTDSSFVLSASPAVQTQSSANISNVNAINYGTNKQFQSAPSLNRFYSPFQSAGQRNKTRPPVPLFPKLSIGTFHPSKYHPFSFFQPHF